MNTSRIARTFVVNLSYTQHPTYAERLALNTHLLSTFGSTRVKPPWGFTYTLTGQWRRTLCTPHNTEIPVSSGQIRRSTLNRSWKWSVLAMARITYCNGVFNRSEVRASAISFHANDNFHDWRQGGECFANSQTWHCDFYRCVLEADRKKMSFEETLHCLQKLKRWWPIFSLQWSNRSKTALDAKKSLAVRCMKRTFSREYDSRLSTSKVWRTKSSKPIDRALIRLISTCSRRERRSRVSFVYWVRTLSYVLCRTK